jgi:hypothetical protein
VVTHAAYRRAFGQAGAQWAGLQTAVLDGATPTELPREGSCSRTMIEGPSGPGVVGRGGAERSELRWYQRVGSSELWNLRPDEWIPRVCALHSGSELRPAVEAR